MQYTGIGIFSEDQAADSTCVTFSGFTLWKNYDFGIYYNNEKNVIFKNNWLIENGVGIFPMVIGPSPNDHTYEVRFSTPTVLFGDLSFLFFFLFCFLFFFFFFLSSNYHEGLCTTGMHPLSKLSGFFFKEFKVLELNTVRFNLCLGQLARSLK